MSKKLSKREAAEIYAEGVKAGRKSAYMGSYGHNEPQELMFSRVRNPYLPRCPECGEHGWDGTNHHDRNSTSCSMCGNRRTK